MLGDGCDHGGIGIIRGITGVGADRSGSEGNDASGDTISNIGDTISDTNMVEVVTSVPLHAVHWSSNVRNACFLHVVETLFNGFVIVHLMSPISQ